MRRLCLYISKERGVSMKLTAKQEAFAKAIAFEGMNNTEAYRSVYSVKGMSDKTVHEEACKLANSPKITTRVKELSKEIDSPRIMSATRRRERLTEFAEGEDANTAIKAIDLLNRMDGEYVQKVVADVSYEDNLKKLVDEDEY